MTDDHASLVAFFVAPIVPAVGFAIFSPGLGGGPSADIVLLAGLSVLGYFFSFFAVGLFGLPAFLILRRYSLDGPLASTTSGALLGLVAAFMLVPRPAYLSTADWLWEIQGVVLISGAAGLAFWATRIVCLQPGRSKKAEQ